MLSETLASGFRDACQHFGVPFEKIAYNIQDRVPGRPAVRPHTPEAQVDVTKRHQARIQRQAGQQGVQVKGTALPAPGQSMSPELNAAVSRKPSPSTGVRDPQHGVESGMTEKLPGVGNAVRRFGAGQAAHGRNLLQGLGSLGTAEGRGLAGQSAWGLAPSAALAAGGLYLGKKLLSPDEKQQQQGGLY